VVFDDNFQTVFTDGKPSEEVEKFAISFLLKAMTVMWRRNTTKMVFLFTSHHLWMRFGYQNLNVANTNMSKRSNTSAFAGVKMIYMQEKSSVVRRNLSCLYPT
jgi:hypothetical protein